MTIDEHTGDVAAALDAARPNVETIVEIVDQRAWVARRTDVEIDDINLEAYQPRPSRACGRFIRVLSAQGFIDAVTLRAATDAENYPVLYADESAADLVAVLNDDGASGPGWRDHRVELSLQPTTEWTHWKSHQGLGSQERFASVIQDGEGEIEDPPPSVMLDIAQSFHASLQATVKHAKRLKDNRTQVVYDEDLHASAGEGGTIEIPDTFKLMMRPFYGSPLFEVTARIKYAVKGGHLEIGYQLVRADDIERQAFGRVVEDVDAALPYTVVAGRP